MSDICISEILEIETYKKNGGGYVAYGELNDKILRAVSLISPGQAEKNLIKQAKNMDYKKVMIKRFLDQYEC